MWVPAPRAAVDPATVGLDAGALEMPKAFAQLEAPPVFICGSARSGTTWTFDLFDRHPQVAAICESWILSQTHGVTSILTQPYWDEVARQAWQERVEVPFGAVQLLSYEEVLRDLRELVGRWLMKGFSAGHRYLAAKEPLDVGAAAILFPEARFIHVLRDGRNVALSMKRASESWDPTMGVGLPMEMRAEAWRRQVENIRSQRAGLGGRYMEIRYEEMRADVSGALRTMFDFAGTPYDDRLLEEIAATTQLDAYGEPALQSGFRGGGEKGGWRRKFSLREAWGFHRAAGELLVELGYESDVRWWARRWAQRRRVSTQQD
jgi:hypothetical protein